MSLAEDFKDYWEEKKAEGSEGPPAFALRDFAREHGCGWDYDWPNPGHRQSIDPSWEVTFEDGSRVYIGNPLEECFEGFVDVEEEAEA